MNTFTTTVSAKKPNMAALVHSALKDLERYAKNITYGGVDPHKDSGWLRLVKTVHSTHEKWAQQYHLPPLGDHDVHNLDDLKPWAARLPYANAKMSDVATWICHVDAARSLVDWAIAAEHGSERNWPPGVRDCDIPISSSAWATAAGKSEDTEWLRALLHWLIQYSPEAAKDPTAALRLLLTSCDGDLHGVLPALIARLWWGM